MSISQFTESGRRNLKLMAAEYTTEKGGYSREEPVVHLFCRDEYGNKHHLEVDGFYPYFYVRPEEFEARKDDLLNDTKVRHVEIGSEQLDEMGDEDLYYYDMVHEVDEPMQTLHDEPLVKIVAGIPAHVGNEHKGFTPLRKLFNETWEADVFFEQRFLISTGIKTHLNAPIGKDRIDVDEIEPVDAESDDAPDVRPRLITLDIEVMSDGSIPDVGEAEQPVTSISAHDNYDDEYKAWVFRYDGWESDPDHDLCIPDGVDEAEIEYYDHEGLMLDDFHDWVAERSPDLMSGWNSNGFDFPYLINRSYNVNAYHITKWSPLDGITERDPTYVTRGNSPVVKGVELFDMYEAYEETQVHELRSYSLDYVAEKELGFGKEDMPDIDEAWMNNPEQFIKYNIRDTEAVVEIEKAQDILDMYDLYREVTGQFYTECHHAISLIDMLFLRDALDAEVALPTSTKPDTDHYHGAKVFDPTPGKHENVFYPDLASLYPNLFYAMNASPETIIGKKDDLEESEYTEEDCHTIYIDPREDTVKKEADNITEEEVYVLKPEIEKGFVRNSIEDLIEMKYEYKGTDKYEAVKRNTNAVYGVMGDKDTYGRGFRLFNEWIAEGITLAGRKVLEHTATTIVDWLQNNGYADAKLIGGDTDSAMCSVPSMDVNEYVLEAAHRGYDEHDIFKAAEYANQTYDEFMEETFDIEKDHRMAVEIESYATACFFLYDFDADDGSGVKKRYSQVITWDEDDGVIKMPVPKTKGFELVRSDSAPITAEAQEKVLEMILRQDDAKSSVFDYLEELVQDMKDGKIDLEEAAMPSAISSKPPEDYGTENRRPMPHVRGAKYASEHIDGEDIGQGSKPLKFPVRKIVGNDYPHHYSAETAEDGDTVDYIAVEDVRNIPNAFKIDWDLQVEKVLRNPIEPVLRTMGWEWEDVTSTGRQSGLDQFA